MDVLEIIVKGIVIGVVASAPMGPVGVLCIQRTLNKGRAYGLVTGVGAALSDILIGIQQNRTVFMVWFCFFYKFAVFWYNNDTIKLKGVLL